YAARFTSSTPVGVVGTLAMTPNVSIINAMVASTAGAYSLMGLQSTYAWAKADTAMLPLMREILSSIATYYKGMKTLHSLLQEHPGIVNRLEHFQKLDDFIRNAQNSKDLHRLFQTLESFSFNPENNYLFRPGEVLLAWELLHSGGGKKGKGKQSTENSPPTAGDIIRAAFDEALPAIGEIDALISAAKLVKESEHSSAKYCFPTFILKSDQPILNLQEVWNPMISPDNAVPNSISLGGGSPSKGAILTGPNGGGKSSFGKAILIAVCMSSFGICPAKEATLTPFNYVRSSMNITDSIENQESLYQAQCSLVGKIVSDVESLPSNIFSLTVLDELFTQTKSEEGSALAQASAMSLSAIPGNINILVTHFRSIPEAIGDQIGDDGKSTSYQNYKMEEGSFRLERGIYEGVNAFDVARDFGVGSKILDLAQNTLNNRK
ncbi:MAG: hypothetical protein JSS09_03605, partial [Verrucomicrobia bacterium]|nr:hypothetical protein [Verrucomicrobiota bacterium]